MKKYLGFILILLLALLVGFRGELSAQSEQKRVFSISEEEAETGQRLGQAWKPVRLGKGKRCTYSWLAQKYLGDAGKWQEIYKKNDIEPTQLRAGHLIWVPVRETLDPFGPLVTEKKGRIVVAKRVSQKKQQAWNPGSAPTKENPLDSIKKTPSFKVLSEKQQWAIYLKMVRDDFEEVIIPDGWPVHEMTAGDRSGRTYVITNRIADLSKTGPLKAHLYRAEGVPVEFVHVLHCNNMARGGPLAPPSVEKPPKKEVPSEPEEEGELPSIFTRPPVPQKPFMEHEVNAGVGAWVNEDNTGRGVWWFGEYKGWLARQSTSVMGGELVPGFGFFAKGDFGSTSSDFEWNNVAGGPEAGGKWRGVTKKGHPHQAQAMVRLLGEWMSGKNDSGYSKDEFHLEPGYYAEYLRWLNDKWMIMAYSEGSFDLLSSFESTWSGDRATDRTSATIGAKVHRKFSDKWAGRAGVQAGYFAENNRVGFNAHLEARYKEMFMFGPSIDFNAVSQIPEEAGSLVFGSFARIELGPWFEKKYYQKQMSEVQAADRELFEYADEEGEAADVGETESFQLPDDYMM